MTLATALAELKASLDQGNEALTTKHFRLLIQALEQITLSDVAAGNLQNVGMLDFSSAVELTIAAGAVTVTQTVHTIDTEADAATDDLDTINASTGNLIIIRAASSARTVVVKDGTGNLSLAGGDFSMDDNDDMMVLLASVGGVCVELCRSNNA